MALKAMETSIVVIVAAVVILITALVIISVFTGGLGTFNSIFNPWAQATGKTALCQSLCQTSCASTGQQPDPNTVNINGKAEACPTCSCSTIGSRCSALSATCTSDAECCSKKCTTTGGGGRICTV